MRGSLRLTSLHAALVVLSSGVLVLVVWRSGGQQRNDLSTFGSYAAALLVPALGYAHYLQRDRPVVPRRTLAETADLLAAEFSGLGEAEKSERGLHNLIQVSWALSREPLTNPVSAAVGSSNFCPLPDLQRTGLENVREGCLDDLYRIYGGLGSGRLLITGSTGSGKSGAAIYLLLNALRHRESLSPEQQASVPVPVLFTLHGWDPLAQRIDEWLAVQLQAYPFLNGKRGLAEAEKLIKERKIAALLDGFEEIPKDLRAKALEALNECRTLRLVLFARTADLKATGGCLLDSVALELQPVAPTEASEYLTRAAPDPPPDWWRDLTERLAAGGDTPISRALRNPLALSLVCDVYRHPDDVREFLAHCDRDTCSDPCEHAEDFLIAKVLEAAYRRRPGKKETQFDLVTAERTLRRIAVSMDARKTLDLEWWAVCSWTSWIPRSIVTGITLALIFAVVGKGIGGLAEELGAGARIGLVTGAILGFYLGRGGRPPLQVPGQWWRSALRLRPVVFGLAYGAVTYFCFRFLITLYLRYSLMAINWIGADKVALIAGSRFSLVSRIRPGPSFPSSAGLAVGIVTGICIWLWHSLGASTGLVEPPARKAKGPEPSVLSPMASWRGNRRCGLIAGVMMALMIGLAISLVAAMGTSQSPILQFGHGPRGWLGLGPWAALVAGPVIGLAIALVVPQTWAASLAFVQLAIRRRTPVHLMAFLEEARELKVLRIVGPAYQFRHANLQDHLASVPRVPRRPILLLRWFHLGRWFRPRRPAA
jgi:hypothetical protein